MKQCDWDGCDEQVNDWMEYCVNHYVQTEKMKKAGIDPKKAMNKEMQDDRSPVEQPRAMTPEERTPAPPPRPVPRREAEQERPKPKNIGFELPDYDDETRLELKVIAFKTAVEFVKEQDVTDFDNLVDNIRTLTAQFYRIISEYNEKSKELR